MRNQDTILATAALSALVETENWYCFYVGAYVGRVGRFTPIYMALIDPFRKLVVYLSLLRTVGRGGTKRSEANSRQTGSSDFLK